MRRFLLSSAVAVAAVAGPASADLISEIRLGVMQENICVLDCNNANKEPGQSLSGEILFNSPDFLGVLWSPKPYVMGSGNLQGDTSFGGVGLHWSFPIAKRWQFEPSVGYVIHDGELESPYVLLGSRDLFRTTFGLHHDINDVWGVELMYEHLSHGQILGDGRNQGLDNIGLRVSYSFD
jgi:lipid A 3-O-deacylase